MTEKRMVRRVRGEPMEWFQPLSESDSRQGLCGLVSVGEFRVSTPAEIRAKALRTALVVRNLQSKLTSESMPKGFFSQFAARDLGKHGKTKGLTQGHEANLWQRGAEAQLSW